MNGKADPSPTNARRQQTIRAVAWFSVLMHAKERNDFQEAAKAQHELERWGVVVKFRRRKEGTNDD